MAPKATPVTNTGDTVSAAALGLEFDLGSFFLDEDEKNAAIDQETEFYITGIDYDEENQYGPRYILTVEAAGAETPVARGWSMAATNGARNNLINNIMNAMSNNGIRRVGPIVFFRKGRTIVFEPVESHSSAVDLPF